LGVSPRKTKTARPTAEACGSADFWRGCWDGDGEVDEGNKCPTLSLVGSFPLVEAFCAFFAGLCPEYPLRPRPTGHTDCTAYVNLYGHGAMVLLKALYGGGGAAMPRKKALAVELLTRYEGKEFRILKAGITQWTTFPYTYTDLRKAHEAFAALQSLDARTLVKPLVKGSVSLVETSVIEASRTGLYASHFFHESVRMRARVRGKPSPAEMWDDLLQRERIIMEAENRKHSSLRASLTANARPCWGFRPAVAKAVYQHFGAGSPALRILDPCAGWGDRLTAALSLPNLGRYRGFDPNRDMAPVYERLRNCHAGAADASVVTGAFEDAEPEEAGYDIVFTSPPYYDYEEYSDDPEQSFRRYPSPEEWTKGFLYPLVAKSAAALAFDGVLAINLSDAGPEKLVDALVRGASAITGLRFAGTLLMQTGNFERAHEGIYCWRKTR
jgi:hypothetical protein